MSYVPVSRRPALAAAGVAVWPGLRITCADRTKTYRQEGTSDDVPFLLVSKSRIGYTVY